jgi:hypothetical protein
MSLNKKEAEVSGLTITRLQPALQDLKAVNILPTIEDADSAHSMTPSLTPTLTRNEKEASPFSTTGLNVPNSESKQNINSYDSDVEACLTGSSANVLQSSVNSKGKNDCTVWPGKQALKAQKKAARRQRGCNPMRNLSKRTRIWVKLFIALLVIGIAVGIGIGVSKAVGGGVWSSLDKTKPIS